MLNPTLARAWIDKYKITLANSYEDICKYTVGHSIKIEYLKSFCLWLMNDKPGWMAYWKSRDWELPRSEFWKRKGIYFLEFYSAQSGDY